MLADWKCMVYICDTKGPNEVSLKYLMRLWKISLSPATDDFVWATWWTTWWAVLDGGFV